MTVKELKEALKDVPENTKVVLYCVDMQEEIPIHSVGLETDNQEQPAFCINYY